MIDDLPPAAEIVRELVAGFHQAVARFAMDRI
jgi:hypothetical protein